MTQADPAGPGPPDESRALTGLRAVAALLVMLHHFYLLLALDQHMPMLQWLLRKGYLGVDLFFVLSGFVMSMVYGSWFTGSWSAAAYGRFVARRLARLWPVHAVILALILLLGLRPGAHMPTPNMLVSNFAMVQAWGLSAAINPPAWSVSTEFAAYLLFPVLAVLALRRRWTAVLCAIGAVALLLVCLASAPPLGPGRRGLLDMYFNYSLLPLLRCLAGFVAGMLAWRASAWPWVRRIAGQAWFGPCALLLFVGLLMGRANDLVILAVLPPIVLGFHLGRGAVHRGLGSAPVHGLGLISYSTYLLHYVLLGMFPFGWHTLAVTLPVYLTVTLGLAGVLHQVVERPGRRLLRRWGDRVVDAVFRQRRAAHVLHTPLRDETP